MFLFEISLTIIFHVVSLTYSIPWPEYKFHEIHGPEQVHISYGDTPSEMIVVWSTGNISPNSTSFVTYGLNSDKLDMVVKASDAVLTEGNPNGLDQIHRAVMTGLNPGTTYYYQVHTGNLSSPRYEFVAMKVSEGFAPKLLVFGDMGRHGGAPSLEALIKETQSGEYAAALHVGDFAYDLASDGGENGDEFMRRVVPIGSTLPYMTCPGNHEIPFNFSHYRYRFAMPQISWPTPLDRMWYSFNLGKAHFISYSTEVYFTYNQSYVDAQIEWLIKDLTEANRIENRKEQPWIIAFGHRPMYCSNIDDDDCTTPRPILRAGLEPVFMKYGVDVVIEAHEHSYERLWPVYQGKVYQENYNNPTAPVHIVSGAAGCNEAYGVCVNPMLGPRGRWSAYRSWFPGEYGYGRLYIANATHLSWTQVFSTTGDVEDHIWIAQDNHGPFNKPLLI
ncbi:Iron zinc purple acid phosphatase [Paramuricea clavata]|uniref:Purple acid phosphatase n=1 Tax=Paramuricea clavata TaxID=317549 RepID=A0A6S7FMR6_PARCT|nr:Iron zinc purple acid phosphatase [Paramuricea clavata]